MTRSYHIEHRVSYRPDAPFDWKLYTYGIGHWCIANGYSGSFTSEAEAETAGIEWVRSGLPPCEQKGVAQ